MTHTLKANGRFLLFNPTAFIILLYTLTQGSMDYNAPNTFDPELESGK